MLCQGLVHLKHIYGIYTKKVVQCLITNYIPPVGGILQIILSNMRPQLLDNLIITVDRYITPDHQEEYTPL